jgi:hypothetical protein
MVSPACLRIASTMTPTFRNSRSCPSGLLVNSPSPGDRDLFRGDLLSHVASGELKELGYVGSQEGVGKLASRHCLGSKDNVCSGATEHSGFTEAVIAHGIANNDAHSGAAQGGHADGSSRPWPWWHPVHSAVVPSFALLRMGHLVWSPRRGWRRVVRAAA